MFQNQNTHIENILAKHFANESLLATEKEQLAQWKQENKQEYTRLQHLMQQTASPFVVNTEKAWKKVLEKKQQRTKVDRKNFSLFQKKIIIYGMVASLLLIIGFGAFYTWQNSYKEYYNSDLIAQTYTLPDNSSVTLNRNTRLRYYKNTEKTRRLQLLSGEAFFDVQPDKQHSFVVSTSNADIQVLGTSFNVKTATKSTEVSVKTGIVSLINTKKESLKLTKGEQGMATTEDLIKTTMKNENYLAWKTHKLVFKNISLFDAVKDLSAYYRIKINAPKDCKNCHFSTTFTTETLKEAMEEIKVLTHINYEIKANELFISCVNCK